MVSLLRNLLFRVLFSCALLLGPVGETHAVEGGANAYLLGLQGAQAGILPPPGLYAKSDKYFYHGDAAPSVNFELGGRIVAGVEADFLAEIPSLTLVTNQKILGGTLAFVALWPVGFIDIESAIELDFPTLGITIGTNIQDDLFSYGDLFLFSVLGWHAGNFHWNIANMLLVPIGDYELGRVANLGLNRWAYDVTASITWLNKATGREVSVSPGITFNGTNDDTNYDSGNEFHVEFAAIQHFPKGLQLGVAGYYYDQVTGDSGAGARLGSFKGRVTAVGPFVGFNFKWRNTPVSAKLRWLHEFDVKNRLEGDVGVLNIAFPLGASGPPPAN